MWAGEAWLPLDATWPLAGEILGFAAHPEGVPGEAHRVACVEPFRLWAVPPAADPRAYKGAVVRSRLGGDRLRRERLIARLGDVPREAGSMKLAARAGRGLACAAGPGMFPVK